MLCADDFGGSPAINAAALRLGERGAISAISAFVDADLPNATIRRLRALHPTVALGLHLNLTDGTYGARAQPLFVWLVRSGLPGGISLDTACAEVERQCVRFEQRFGGQPDFIDGHQHVHQLPCIRDAVIAVATGRYGTDIAIRSTRPASWRGSKASLIASLGGRGLEARLAPTAIATNRDFAGVYAFNQRLPYPLRMARWLETLRDGGLLMCHPQMPSRDDRRGARARVAEFSFLESPAWDALRREQRVLLVPFNSQYPS